MKYILPILLTLFGMKNIYSSNYTRGKHALIECSGKISPLFENDETLEVEIIADHEYLNSQRDTVPVTGYVKVNKDKTDDILPVSISTRGYRRKTSCEVKPLRLTFLDPDIHKKVNENITYASSSNQNNDETLPLSNFYNELNELYSMSELIENKSIGISQKINIFEKLGDDIKIVTHCGKGSLYNYAYWKSNQVVGGETNEVQDQKLLFEYYMYKILETFNTTVPKVRLANITYINSNGAIIETRPAFFREPTNNIRKRCDLNKSTTTPFALDSFEVAKNRIIFKLIQSFISGWDYSFKIPLRNIKVVYKDNGSPIYVAYDFDLTYISLGVFKVSEGEKYTKEYHFNKIIEDLKNNILLLKSYNESNIESNLAEQIMFQNLNLILSKKDEITNIISKSNLNEENKLELMDWIESNSNAFEIVRTELRRKLQNPKYIYK